MLPNPDKPHMGAGAGAGAAGNFFYFMGWGGLFRHLSKHFY